MDEKWFPHPPESAPGTNEIPSGDSIKKGAKHPSRFDAQSIDLNNKADQKMPIIHVNETNYELEKEKLVHNMGQMGVVTQCDNAMDNLEMDFDPKDTASKAIYTCMDAIIDPNPNIQPLITLFNAPVKYVPIHRCMPTKLTYNERIPTLGPHRPLWLGFGEYEYAPVQRWLHNIEHGCIIMLYHPCANKEEVFKLRNLLTNCIYRHVITPYEKLDRDRPLALAGWGATLEMSVFDKDLAKNFIVQYAKTGPEKTYDNGQYRHLLIHPALLVTDVTDTVLCPNI